MKNSCDVWRLTQQSKSCLTYACLLCPVITRSGTLVFVLQGVWPDATDYQRVLSFLRDNPSNPTLKHGGTRLFAQRSSLPSH
jgi:hypothetical protein